MRSLILLLVCLLLAPIHTVATGCQVDSLIHALRRPKGAAFCTTYTNLPTGTPLPHPPTLRFPASRISSACSCLYGRALPTSQTTSTEQAFTTSTSSGNVTTANQTVATTLATATRPPPRISSTGSLPSATNRLPPINSTSSTDALTTGIPTPKTAISGNKCSAGSLIANGRFLSWTDGVLNSWTIAPALHGNSLITSISAEPNALTAAKPLAFSISNGQSPATVSTFIKQDIPALCQGTSYILTYSYLMSVQGSSSVAKCNVKIDLNDQRLAKIDPPRGVPLPSNFQEDSIFFTYAGHAPSNTLTVTFSCSAPLGSLKLSEISIIGNG